MTFSSNKNLQPVVIAAASISFLIVFGTSGFYLIEDLSFVDAIYMTVITLSTVGYGEVHPFSPIGRLFSVSLINFTIFISSFGFKDAL